MSHPYGLQNQLFASASSLDQIKALIGRFYLSSNIQLVQTSSDTWDVHNLKGRIDGVHVRLQKGRYRFESI